MKKLVAGLLMTAAISSSAATWVPIGDSDDGVRLLVDTDTFIVSKSEDVHVAGALFMYVTNGTEQHVMAYVTPIQTCIEDGGPIFGREYVDKKWVTVVTHFWNIRGPKMFDSAGRVLCTILSEKMKTEKPTAKKGDHI